MFFLSRRVVLSLALLIGGQWSVSLEAAAAESRPGGTWASIAKLPDWSGTWAMTVKDHEAATKETYADDGGLVPFTPKYQALRAGIRSRSGEESLGLCLPAGVPGLMLHRIGFEWLFTPGRITMITENGEIRRIRTDGSGHRSLDEMEGSYEGDSIGHWEGKTLVVDTIGFPKGSLLKNGDLYATINTHYVERISNIDKDHVKIESTLSDPEIYTRPHTATRIFERVDYPLPEPQCSQTARTQGSGSKEVMDLTPPEK